MTNDVSRLTFHASSHFAIGIDVGGTKIAAGVVDLRSGAIEHTVRVATRPERGGDALLAEVVEISRGLLAIVAKAGHQVCGIGLGLCELVDLQGEVTSAFTIPWQGVPVRATLAQLAPAYVDADVRAHALAEAHFGAGHGPDCDPFVFVSVGTGISCCLVQQGVPYAGARGNALVLATGPITVPGPDGKLMQFVLEEYASGAALAQRYGVARTEEIFADALSGDACARSRASAMLQDAGTVLGSAIGWLCSVLDPAAVIVGGGLGSAPGLYWEALQRSVREHIWSEATRELRIKQAQLGNDAGIIGAALLCKTQNL